MEDSRKTQLYESTNPETFPLTKTAAAIAESTSVCIKSSSTYLVTFYTYKVKEVSLMTP